MFAVALVLIVFGLIFLLAVPGLALVGWALLIVGAVLFAVSCMGTYRGPPP